MVAMTATSLYGLPLQVQILLKGLTTKMTKMLGAIDATYVALPVVLPSQLAFTQRHRQGTWRDLPANFFSIEHLERLAQLQQS